MISDKLISYRRTKDNLRSPSLTEANTKIAGSIDLTNTAE